MPKAIFRFYAELNDFLPAERRQVDWVRPFETSSSVKDMIEALGVPHTEVDLILVNGESVDFSYPVQDGDRISVFPVFESVDIEPLLRVRPLPLRVVRFVIDAHLGRLAVYLRLLGFDVLYRNDYHDDELARISHDERRILLTRDRGLLKRNVVTHGYLVRAAEPRDQVVEVLRRFDLSRLIVPFSRCLHCNSALELARKEDVADRLPPHVRTVHDDFRLCPACRRIYWKGTHYDRMQRFVEEVRRDVATAH